METRQKNNYYSDNTLRVSNKGVNTGALTYLRFDLTESDVSNIDKVTLRLGVHYKEPGEEGNTAVVHEVYGITNDWDPKTMTWESGSPNHNPNPNTYEITGIGTTAFLLDTKTIDNLRWIDFDVTDYVKEKIAEGEDKVSLMLAHKEGAELITLYSKRFDPLLVLSGEGKLDWPDLVNVESEGIIIGDIPQSNLMNGDICVDPEGIVHSVVVRGIWGGKFNHYWRDASGKWHHKQLNFGGVGHKLIADDKAIYNIYRHYNTKKLHIAMATKEKDYADWRIIYEGEDLPMFGSSIQLDSSRFIDEGIITIMVQEQYEVAGDPTPIHVIEWDVSEFMPEPTPEPTTEPSPEPTTKPSPQPTTEPTAEPTAEPTDEPTAEPTDKPTEPTETEEPSEEPSEEPTEDPTKIPTTGDYGITLFALAILLSAAGIKLYLSRRKAIK